MGKYDQQLGNLKDQLFSAANIAIVLPANATVDKLAAGLSLCLSLEKLAGKKVSLVSESSIKVSHTNLFGVDKVSASLPVVSSGNLTITLGDVVAADGTVSALEKLDWYPEGANLNLVFHVLAGQKFEPSKIEPHYSTGSFNLIFILGAASLNELGSIYSANQQLFQGVTLVNIDTSLTNTQFGQVNIVDSAVSSLCEIIYQLLPGLNLALDSDIATNILTGIYDATSNLSQNVKPDTFITVGQLMQAGGKVPGLPAQVNPIPAAVAVQPAVTPSPLSETIQGSQPLIDANNLPQWLNFPTSPQAQPSIQATPPVVSPEELPVGEVAQTPSGETTSPAPDWLTPKIFKGGSLE